MAKFYLGARVTRPKDVFAVQSPLMRGEVVDIYSHQHPEFGYYSELYAVRWDGEAEATRGYLPHGLDFEPYCVEGGQ